MSNKMEVNENNNNEISFIELINILLDKKLWIFLSVLIFTVFAGIYALTSKEQWTSKAVIIAPRITELGNLLPLRAEYARVVGDSEFSASKLASGVHGYLKSLLLSNDLKRQFVEKSTSFNKYFETMNEKQKNIYINKFISEYLNVQQPDNDKKKNKSELNEVGLIISFSAETPDFAQKVLEEYIEFLNKYALQQISMEFKVTFDLGLDGLKFSKEQIIANLNKARKVQIENLTNALDIAKKAGIIDFSKGSANNIAIPEYMLGEAKLNISDSKLADGTYLFMLGEKYLQAQLDIAKNTEIVYPLDYYNIDREISQLEPLVTKLAGSVEGANTYRYLTSPDFPITKDKPKVIIILSIGMLLGLILSCIVIFLISALKRSK